MASIADIPYFCLSLNKIFFGFVGFYLWKMVVENTKSA